MVNPVDQVFSNSNMTQNIVSFLPEDKDRANMRLMSKFCNIQVIRQQQKETITSLDCLIAYLSKELESQEFALSLATREQLTKPITLIDNRRTLYEERARLIDLTVAKVDEKSRDLTSLMTGYIRQPLPKLFMNFFEDVVIYNNIEPDDELLNEPLSIVSDSYEAVRMAATRNINGYNEDDLYDLLLQRMEIILERALASDRETIEKLEDLGAGPCEYVRCIGRNVVIHLSRGRDELARNYMNMLVDEYVQAKKDGYLAEEELVPFADELLAMDHEKVKKVINPIDLLKMMAAGFGQ